MKSSLLVLLAAVFVCDLPLQAQEPAAAPAPPVPSRRRLTVSGNVDSSGSLDLNQSYRISLTITGLNDKKQECSLLTASKQISAHWLVGGPGAESTPGTKVELSGMLEETEEGKVRFRYTLGTSLPVPMTFRSEEKGATTTSYNYANESSTSSLLLTPGKSYEVLKAGDRSYSLKLELVPDEK